MTSQTVYQKKLLDPRWQKKRLEILTRDNFTCISCNDTKNTLHVHHFKYGTNPWTVCENKLITYCVTCHGYIEILKKKYPQYDFLRISVFPLWQNKYIPIQCICYQSSLGYLMILFEYQNNNFKILSIVSEGSLIICYNKIQELKSQK